MKARLASPRRIAEDHGRSATERDDQGQVLGTDSKKRSTPRGTAFGTALDDLVGYNLRRAHSVQKQRFAALFGPLKIRPVTLSVLGTIHDHAGITQTDLSKLLNLKRANMVPVMTELEERGLIVRLQSQEDRRVQVVSLTAAGKKLTNRLLDLHARLEEDLARSLGVRNRDLLVQLLKQFRQLESEPDLADLE